MPDESLILAVTRKNKSLIPDGNFVIEKGDSVLVIASDESVADVESLFKS